MACPTIRKVIPCYRCKYNIAKPNPFASFRYSLRLTRIHWLRCTLFDRAKATIPRANIAHKQKGQTTPIETEITIRAFRLNADGMEIKQFCCIPNKFTRGCGVYGLF
jgi:hypothetical protein